MIIPSEWIELSSNDKRALETELKKEICGKHILHGKTASVIIKRIKRDDILYKVENAPFQFCVVHLTWHIETDKNFPRVIWFKDYDDFLDKWEMVMCDDFRDDEDWRFVQ